MNHIKVSICIPTYQQVEYLKKTLDSIQFQDFHDYEIIVTDDKKYASSILPFYQILNSKKIL
jgi:cellulose synthase/poly-beta-1,6-N-acetylglucosamine synthase-like glycosyltransferase